MRQAKSIGSILVDVELVTQDDIEKALELQKFSGKRLGEVLVNMGVVSDDDIRWALAEQLNLPYVNIRKDQIDPDVAKLLPEKLARRYHVIPILKIGNELTVVVDDPLNTTIIRDIEKMTKAEVKISLGRISDILLAIDEIYGTAEEQKVPEQETPPQFMSSWFHEEDMQKILNDPSGHILMERIITTALSHGISRIYFQPGIDLCHVSYRVNGVLQEQIQLSQEWYSILLFRLKISADFAISETSSPQYREFFYKEHLALSEAVAETDSITLALSILPTTTGESAVLTVINKSVKRIWTQEEEQGEPGKTLQEQEFQYVREFQEQLQYLKHGAVLLAGWSYFEKMTTLYGLLNVYEPLRKKIVILEAHSEYQADNYSKIRYWGEEEARYHHTLHLAQTPASDAREHGEQMVSETMKTQDFLEMLHQPLSSAKVVHPTVQILQPKQRMLSEWLSLLHAHDPDLIVVDHIGSDVVLAQSMDFAGEALVFGSLDLPNVFQLLTYFSECGIQPSIITARIRALMAQYSLRILCQECKQRDTTELGQELVDRLYQGSDSPSPEIFMAGGCPLCNMSGYVAQITLLEILPMAQWLKELLLTGTPIADIQQAAAENGFISLETKGKDLLFSGQTSLEEIFSLLTD